MKTSILSFASLLLVGLMFFSCEQLTQKKLEGKWEMLTVPNPGYEEDWTFTATTLVITRTNTGDSTANFTDSGTYTIHNNTITTTGEGLASSGVEYYRGDFQINRLTNSQLILIRDDQGLQYYEFVKK